MILSVNVTADGNRVFVLLIGFSLFLRALEMLCVMKSEGSTVVLCGFLFLRVNGRTKCCVHVDVLS